MIVGVVTETFPGEKRVALTPDAVALLARADVQIHIQSGAGEQAGFTDTAYRDKGAELSDQRKLILRSADVLLQVRTYPANPVAGAEDLPDLKAGQLIIGFADPLTAHAPIQLMSKRGVTLAAIELLPRISRAQSMDALSSQANLVGYKAVLLAANHLGKIFPMLMTAAGTITPARVFVVGAGVMGLQAIATAKRLGAMVSAIDVRPETREQVESLGATFVSPPQAAAGEGGYAREQTEQQKQAQQEMMAQTVAASDVVITTAAVPGRRSPVLISAKMVQSMAPGAVVMDMAADNGGNCALTQPGQTVMEQGVSILGPTNVASMVASDASRMYAHNLSKLLMHLLKGGQIQLDLADEITAGVIVCRQGRIIHPRVRQAMGLSDAVDVQDAQPPQALQGLQPPGSSS